MWWLAVEALGALLLFVFIIWWTMFSGRKRGELVDEDIDDQAESPPAPAPAPAPGSDDDAAASEERQRS